mgnify:CR=1 FL=1
MTRRPGHLGRCLVAGLVALLPLGGAVAGLWWLEDTLSGSWRKVIGFYVPGLGLLLALVVAYLVGLFVTTVVGRWLWRRADRVLEGVPLLGAFYQSLKEVLGYDSGRTRFFRAVVLVPSDGGHELGFVTGELDTAVGPRVLVFVPGAPNPTNGRLVVAEAGQLVATDLPPAAALRGLVSMGKAGLPGRAAGGPGG